MIWDNFEYSKNQVRKAIKMLVENNISTKQRLEAIKKVANFRSSHGYPIQSMIGYFRKKAFEVDKGAIVVRRLKRIPSIVGKLKRIPTMQISTMGDIGGIRIILNDIKKVTHLKNNLVSGRTKNKLLSEKNYIENPKESGYRSVHLNYCYQGSKQEYKGFRVELQIRSRIQHSWATAVEIIGTFQQQNLKASQGNENWLSFFKLASQAFAFLEKKTPITNELKRKIENSAQQLNAIEVISSFTVATKYSDKKEGHYLLQLDITKKTMSARFFTDNFLNEAEEEYRRIEQEISEDTSQDVVLVSAKSIKELKKAYPNYFADTHLFLVNLNLILKN